MRPGLKLILVCECRIVIMKARNALRPELADLQPPEPAEGRELLADHTTLRVGGPARRMITVETEAELVEAVADLDANAEPLLVLGGGSNVLVG